MNIITIDFEDWYHLLYSGIAPPMDQWDHQTSILEKNTCIILNLLKQYNTKATFFVLGRIAEKFPQLVLQIADHGHEIASHGYSHRKIDELTPEEFKNDLSKSKESIYKACGEIPIGYRAPGFSVTRQTSWALDIIKNEGFIYDSSILSSNLKYFDIINKSYPRLNNGLYELFINNNLFSVNILGGVMFRIIPQKILLKVVKKNNRSSIPSILIIHPREINRQLPKLNLGIIQYFKIYYKLDNCINNLRFLLEHFKWVSAESFIRETDLNNEL
jgi:polysaccharide deacetylase family protein (PEP-CTERM system associated)